MDASRELQVLRERNESFRLLLQIDNDDLMERLRCFTTFLENVGKRSMDHANVEERFDKRLEAERSYNLQMEAAKDKERSHELQMANIKLQMMYMERDRA